MLHPVGLFRGPFLQVVPDDGVHDGLDVLVDGGGNPLEFLVGTESQPREENSVADGRSLGDRAELSLRAQLLAKRFPPLPNVGGVPPPKCPFRVSEAVTARVRRHGCAEVRSTVGLLAPEVVQWFLRDDRARSEVTLECGRDPESSAPECLASAVAWLLV